MLYGSQSKAFEHVERALGKNTLIKRSGVFCCSLYSIIGQRSRKDKGEVRRVVGRSQANIEVCIPVFSMSKKGVVLNQNNFQAYVLLVNTACTSHVGYKLLFMGI